jgi:hypothetical protein
MMSKATQLLPEILGVRAIACAAPLEVKNPTADAANAAAVPLRE